MLPIKKDTEDIDLCDVRRVSVQRGKSHGGQSKKNIFQNEKGNTFALLVIFIVKSLQKEQNSTNLLNTLTPNLPE